MAKIKVKGELELITVPEKAARAIIEGKRTGELKDSDDIQLGSYYGPLGDIRYFYLGEQADPGAAFQDTMAVMNKRDNELRSMDPVKHAELAAWGHFSLFFYGVYGRWPKEEPDRVEKVRALAADFYRANPRWTVPSVKVWQTFLRLTENDKINPTVLRFFQRTESFQFGEEARPILNYDS